MIFFLSSLCDFNNTICYCGRSWYYMSSGSQRLGLSLALAESSLCVKEELFQSWQEHQHWGSEARDILQVGLSTISMVTWGQKNAYNNTGNMVQLKA